MEPASGSPEVRLNFAARRGCGVGVTAAGGVP